MRNQQHSQTIGAVVALVNPQGVVSPRFHNALVQVLEVGRRVLSEKLAHNKSSLSFTIKKGFLIDANADAVGKLASK